MSSIPERLTRRSFLKSFVRSAVGITILGGGCTVYASNVEPNWIEVTAVSVTLPRLAPEFDGYRLVQISDIHIDSRMPLAFLFHVIELVNQQVPDMIAITGDFVSMNPNRFSSNLIAALSQLAPRDVTVAILGNRDYCPEAMVVRDVIDRSGIINLCNRVYSLNRGGSQLNVAGVDDVLEKRDRLDLVLDTLSGTGTAILLAHEPDFADVSAATGRFDMQISGHSHGGQVNLPYFGPLVLPSLAKKYPIGRYQVDQMIQYTNRGIGMVEPYFRFNCRPEITVFTLNTPSKRSEFAV